MWVWDEADIWDMSELLKITCVSISDVSQEQNFGPIRQNIPKTLLN